MKYIASSLLVCLMLTACGKSEAPAPAAEAPKVVEPAPVAAVDPVGEKIFKGTCSLCHATGAGGAPIAGNKADWEPRVAQGKDVLYKHALEGFTGQKGAMPPKGGAVNLSDDDIKAAVDHMLAKLK